MIIEADNVQVFRYNAEMPERLDLFLSNNCDLSRSRIASLIENGCVKIDGTQVSKKYKPKYGDIIELYVPPVQKYEIIPQNIPLDILYEDDYVIVVNKPKGMVVHPAAGNYTNTLVNALMYHCKENLSGINGVARPGIIHRIDKNTSGLLLIAKCDEAHLSLSEQIKKHSCNRIYNAIVYGNIKSDEGTINAPITRDKQNRKKMAIDGNGKEAITHYKVLERYNGFTYMEFKLETGRTHQIRVHMAYIGHPIAGDDVYGPRNVIAELNGQCLHAKQISFTHPTTGEEMLFTTPLPEYFTNFINKCKNK